MFLTMRGNALKIYRKFTAGTEKKKKGVFFLLNHPVKS